MQLLCVLEIKTKKYRVLELRDLLVRQVVIYG